MQINLIKKINGKIQCLPFRVSACHCETTMQNAVLDAKIANICDPRATLNLSPALSLPDVSQIVEFCTR